MDGVFMKKYIKLIASVCFLLYLLGIADIYKDKTVLKDNLIRLHVVANSDSREDQENKLRVKDAVVAYLQPLVKDFLNKEQAMVFVKDNLSTIRLIANEVLEDRGTDDRAVVYLRTESFDTRKYETFSLPAGLYDSLRIEIGEGDGKNWWCVVFPSLCLPATSDGFQDAAVSSGLSADLGSTLADGNNFRFFILDCLGRIENLFN